MFWNVSLKVALKTALLPLALAVCAATLFTPGLALAAGAASSTSHAQSLPPALRPALYRALAKDAGPAYGLNKVGCAVLSKSKLKACFDSGGAHFSGAGLPLALHLVAFGRGDTRSPVKPVHPVIHANQVNYSHGNLTEWWRVLPMGYEQGFTVAKRPAGHGKLTIALVASRQDDGAPSNPGNSLAWGKLRYGKLVVTDAAGKVVPATLKNEGDRVLIAVNDVHAVYPLTVDPLVWLEEQKTTANDGATTGFGVSVALDGATAIIGASYTTINGPYQGAAYIFQRTADGTWMQTAKLTASDGEGGDFFGNGVALSGKAALVGAPEADVNGNGSQGAAYVFSESDGTWSQTAKLTASDGGPTDQFGYSVALSGKTALVGASTATVNGNVQGAAYVFGESDGNWAQRAKLTPDADAEGDFFGWAVSLDGTTALVGAPRALPNNGAVYVFSGSSGWEQTAKLTASDGGLLSQFGWSVAVSGTTALVGSVNADVNGNPNRGAAYVFTKSNGTWAQTAKLFASDETRNVDFGTSVALDGTTALVGALDADVNGNREQGAVYVFIKSDGGWDWKEGAAWKLTSSDGAAGDNFGVSVAVSGTTSLIGAYHATINGNLNQGAAYFYGESDLRLALSAPEAIGQGQQYVSQTIATNYASAASPAVAVTVAIPAAASFVSATATQGSCSEVSGVVTCDFGRINGNVGTATANVTLKAAGAPGTTIENTASVAKATHALRTSAPTEITSPGSCPAGYTEFSGHLDAGEAFTSSPIEVTEAGQKYIDLTSPASFAFFAITNTRYGQHTYVYPHVKHGHRWGAAGSYQVGVQAGPDAGGDYTLCVNLNPAQ